MAKGFDVLNVKSAVKARNKINLDSITLATMNFGQIVPLWNTETVPGDDIKTNATFYSRMAPLVKPTYGKFSFRTMVGFVPYHQIADDAEAWIAGSTTWEGETTKQRWFTIDTLLLYVDSYLTGSGTADNADLVYKGSAGTIMYRKLTAKGKYFVKILNALGYTLPESADRTSGSTWLNKVGNKRLSAYPLLAFFKLYNDYMSQSQRYNTSELTNILKTIKHSKTYTGYNSTTGEISYNLLNTMFNSVLLNYENDYFTSAWQYPNTPLYGDPMITSMDVPGKIESEGQYADSISRFNSDDYLTTYDANPFYKIGQRSLDFLKAFDDWVRRNNYSGSRSVQRIYSRFGIKTDDYRSNYAHILGTDIMPIEVGDVTATAEAQNVPLGDYAGKGILSGNKSIAYKADDYGLLMLLGWFTVTPMNAYGFDKKVLRNTPLDYYNPEFDGLGAEAISAGEYFTSPIVDPTNDNTLDTDVFGYTERYNSYRYGRDVILGDFRKFRNNDDMNTWHTGRLMTDIRLNNNLIAQSSAVNTLPQTNSEYNRIFSITDDSEDKFYLTCQFNVPSIRPMLNLNQVVRLGEGNTNVPRNGNVVD